MNHVQYNYCNFWGEKRIDFSSKVWVLLGANRLARPGELWTHAWVWRTGEPAGWVGLSQEVSAEKMISLQSWRNMERPQEIPHFGCGYLLIFRCVHPSGGLVDYALEESGFMNHQQTFLWLSLLTLVNGCLFIVEFLNSCRWETSMVL